VLHVRRLTQWQSVPRYNICNGLACFCRAETALLVLLSCAVACSCIDLQGTPQTLTCNGCSVLTDYLHVTDTDFVSKLLTCSVEERVPQLERWHCCYSLLVEDVPLLECRHCCYSLLVEDVPLLERWHCCYSLLVENMCHCWNVYIVATLFLSTCMEFPRD
jgi:hypothetical protein